MTSIAIESSRTNFRIWTPPHCKQSALADMDEFIMLSVLAMFLADGQELIAQLELVLASADDDALAKTAHKLGGNTATCGQTGPYRIILKA